MYRTYGQRNAEVGRTVSMAYGTYRTRSVTGSRAGSLLVFYSTPQHSCVAGVSSTHSTDSVLVVLSAEIEESGLHSRTARSSSGLFYRSELLLRAYRTLVPGSERVGSLLALRYSNTLPRMDSWSTRTVFIIDSFGNEKRLRAVVRVHYFVYIA